MKEKSSLLSWSEATLIGANIVPLIGVLLFGWSIFMILFMYWLENVVVGIYNVLKIAKLKLRINPESESVKILKKKNEKSVKNLGSCAKAVMIIFFIFHFGLFTFVHGVFVVAVFYPEGLHFADFASDGFWMFIVLMISHGFSYVQNFLGKKEYEKMNMGQVFVAPYSRVIVMHLVVIFGAICALQFGAPLGSLVVLIVLKTSADFAAHKKEHLFFGSRKQKSKKEEKLFLNM